MQKQNMHMFAKIIMKQNYAHVCKNNHMFEYVKVQICKIMQWHHKNILFASIGIYMQKYAEICNIYIYIYIYIYCINAKICTCKKEYAIYGKICTPTLLM